MTGLLALAGAVLAAKAMTPKTKQSTSVLTTKTNKSIVLPKIVESYTMRNTIFDIQFCIYVTNIKCYLEQGGDGYVAFLVARQTKDDYATDLILGGCWNGEMFNSSIGSANGWSSVYATLHTFDGDKNLYMNIHDSKYQIYNHFKNSWTDSGYSDQFYEGVIKSNY